MKTHAFCEPHAGEPGELVSPSKEPTRTFSCHPPPSRLAGIFAMAFPHFSTRLRSGWGQTRQISHEAIVLALVPHTTLDARSSGCPVKPFCAQEVTSCAGVELPNELALAIASALPDVASLDALACTSTSWRSIAREHDAEAAQLRRWLPQAAARAAVLHEHDARTMCHAFERLHRVASAMDDGWNAVLWQSAALGCVHGVWCALQAGADPTITTWVEGPPLWAAAKFDQLPVVRLLHEHAGVNLEARGGINTNSTPLWVATRQGHHRVVEYLLAAGADAASRSRNGRGHSVLDVATQAVQNERGGVQMLEMLAALQEIQ
jgi:hypothetical protein